MSDSLAALEEKRRQRELERQKELEELERKRKEREEKRRRDREELERKERELQEKKKAARAGAAPALSTSIDTALQSQNSRSKPDDGRLTSSAGSKAPETNGNSAEEERKKQEEEQRKKKEEEDRLKKAKEDEEKNSTSRGPGLTRVPSSTRTGGEMDSELERLRKEREKKAQERETRKKQAEEEALALKKKLEALKEQKEKELEEKLRKEEERKKELEEELRKQREQVEKLAKEKEKEMDKELKRERERLERERLRLEREQREKEREEERKRRDEERKERERKEAERREAEKKEREERDRLRREKDKKDREDREAERERKLKADRDERERRRKEREEEEQKEKEREEQERQKRRERDEKDRLEAEERERKKELERKEKERKAEEERKAKAEEAAKRRKELEEQEEETKLLQERAILLKKLNKDKKKKEREEERERIRREEEERKRKKEEEELEKKRLAELDEEDEEILQLKLQLERLNAENARMAEEEKLKQDQRAKALEDRKSSRSASRKVSVAGRTISLEKLNSSRMATSTAEIPTPSSLQPPAGDPRKRSQSHRARKILIPADDEDLLAIFTENREKTSSMRSGKSDSGKSTSSVLAATGNAKEKAAAAREKKNPVLIQLKGDKRVHVRKCETAASSLNYSDVFVLDAGDKIYQWNGPLSNRTKRAKGVDVANAINKKQRSGGADVVIIEALIDVDDGTPKEFWAALGGKPESIPQTKGSDAQLEKQWNESDKLFRVNPGGELFKIDGGITRAKLANNFVYVLDCTTEVYVWCGKETDAAKKEEAVRSAKRLFLKTERPPWSVLRKINEGAEPVLFIEKFTKWEVSKKKIGKAAALAASTLPGAAPAVQRPVKTESPIKRSNNSITEEEILKQYDKTYTYDQLTKGEYPDSINTAKKETYLSDSEFQSVFGMTKEAFAKLPSWKIRELKIKMKLF